MWKLISIYCFITAAAFADFNASRIPATNLMTWTHGTTIGVFGGMRTRSGAVIDVTQAPYSADNTGVTDATTAINDAIVAASSGDTIKIPTGLYLIEGAIRVLHNKDNVTIKGDGPAFTKLNCNPSGTVYVGTDNDFLFNYPSRTNWVMDGMTRGSSNVVITNVTDYAAGKMMKFYWEDDTNLVFTTGGTGAHYQEQVMITAVSGNSVSFWPPLTKGASYLELRSILVTLQTDFVGIEDLEIWGTNTSSSSVLRFEQCYSSWASNVNVKGSPNYHIQMGNCLFGEVTRCIARKRVGAGSNGATLLLGSSTGCYIYNNLLMENFPILEVNSGCTRNVFSYNFCYDSTTAGVNAGALLINHGPHNAFNLYEGNLAPNIASDGYFGSLSHESVHRNWFFGIAPAITNTFQVSFKRFNRYIAFEGNIVGLGVSPQPLGWDNAFMGEPNIGGTAFTGTASPSTGDWWTNYPCYGVITNRVDDRNTDVHILVPSSLIGVTNAFTGVAPSWYKVSFTYPSYTYVPDKYTMTNMSDRQVTLKSFGVADGDVVPANGTAVRLWFGNLGYQEADLDVSNTVSVANNYLFNDGIPANEVVSGSTNSYYLTAKPSFFPSSYTWPPINSASVQTTMNLTNFVLLPAQYAFLNGAWPTESVDTFVTNTAPRFRGIRLR